MLLTTSRYKSDLNLGMKMASVRSRTFKVGEKIRAQVSESPSKGVLIMDIEGSLYRVINATFAAMRIGDWVTLRVHGIDPLELKIDSPTSNSFVRLG